MSKVFIDESTLTAIANAIRTKNGKTDMISPLDMPSEIESIKSGWEMITVEGNLPLTVEGIEQRLEDYKIYGADGGVGDKTENLFNIKNHGFTSNANGVVNVIENTIKFKNTANSYANYVATTKISAFGLEPSKTYTSKCKVREKILQSGGGDSGSMKRSLMLQDNNSFSSSSSKLYIVKCYGVPPASDGYYYTKFKTPEDMSTLKYITTRLTGYSETTFENLMIVEGSYTKDTFPEYEPYGYKLPVMVNDKITEIFIGLNQLNADDYIDFENRMIVIDGVETLMKLPEIYLENGQNVIDVDTTVKSSKMSISYVV